MHQDVEHDATLIYGTPQPMLLAIDDDDDFVQILLVAKGSWSRSNAPRRLLNKLECPSSNGFIGHFNAASGPHFLDHSKAQEKAKIQPDRVADWLWWKAVAGI